MGDFNQLIGGGRVDAGSRTSATSRGILVSGGAANVKGSYAELLASADVDYDAILLQAASEFDIDDYLLDIAVGAGGSEQIILADWLAGTSRASSTSALCVTLPLKIDAGTRVSARCQCNRVSSSKLLIGLHLIKGGFLAPSGFTSIDTMGADTTNTRGQIVDPGAVANTKGAYTEIIASTVNAYGALTINVSMDQNLTVASVGFLVDIAIGAAASEVVIVEDLTLISDAAADALQPGSIYMIPVSVPEGSRLAVRAQSASTDATDRLFTAALYGHY